MELVRIRVREDFGHEKHMWCERWWTRVWVMTPKEHYPPHIWDRLMGHHALEIESTQDGTNWERIWPMAKPDPKPEKKKFDASHIRVELPPEEKEEKKKSTPKKVPVCERCGKVLSDKDIEKGRTKHWRCPGKKSKAKDSY